MYADIVEVDARDIMSFTVADATQISKGVLLKLTDPRTASLMTNTESAAGQPRFLPSAGISASEKKASDGSTRLGAYRKGVFDMVCSGAVAIGAQVAGIVDGYVFMLGSAIASGSYVSGAIFLGTALEEGSDAERINIAVDL